MKYKHNINFRSNFKIVKSYLDGFADIIAAN